MHTQVYYDLYKCRKCPLFTLNFTFPTRLSYKVPTFWLILSHVGKPI